MINSGVWPRDYFHSRSQFIKAAENCGARLDTHKIAALGPDNESLHVDVAAITAADDEHRVIVTSGVHGVEGFIGACTQIRALQVLQEINLPGKTGVVLIHAVNPWGYAHLRRVDENNVDVNRNFLETAASTPTSHPDYTTLNPVINPPHAPDTGDDLRYWLSACQFIIRHRGIARLAKPIAEGQYDFPKGLFYGGAQMGESCMLVQELVHRLAINAAQVSILDIHSGLGPSGKATLIGNSNMIAPSLRQSVLQSHYNKSVLIDDASTNAYNAQATFSQWCLNSLGKRQVLYLCIEMGTVNPIRLFSALKRENQAHHWSPRSAKVYKQTKHDLLKVFAPDSLRWRSQAVDDALQVFMKTLDAPSFCAQHRQPSAC